MQRDPLVVVARVAEVFEDLGIPYLLGGSWASSMYGIPRATNDADFAAALALTHAEPLTRAFEGTFYVDIELILDAIRRRTSFNLIHLETMFKVDVFVVGKSGWPHEQLMRARSETISQEAGGRAIRFASPEDTILQKLLWYRMGGEISEQQWRDIRGVLMVQGSALDAAYLNARAGELDIRDLLNRARESLPG